MHIYPSLIYVTTYMSYNYDVLQADSARELKCKVIHKYKFQKKYSKKGHFHTFPKVHGK